LNFKLLNSDISPSLGKMDFRVQGRFMQLKFECKYPYSVGTILLNFKMGDSQ
jgi:hypothetical protein